MSFNCLDPSLSLRGYYALEASAGTGKTFAIEHLTARLILEGFELEDILIVTFTRAATRELKNRIRQLFEGLLNETIVPPYFNSQKRFEIEKALIQFDQAQIFTIHGFCQKMLTDYGFESNASLNFQSPDDKHYKEHLRLAITDFFRTSLSAESYSTYQLAALMRSFQYDKDKLIEKILFLIEQDTDFPVYSNFKTSYEAFLKVLPTLPKLHIKDIVKVVPAFLKFGDRSGNLKKEEQNEIQQLLETLQKPSPETFDTLLKTHSPIIARFTPENRSKKSFSDVELAPFYFLHDKLYPLLFEAAHPKHTLMRIAAHAKDKVKNVLHKQDLFTPDDLLRQMESALEYPAFVNQVSKRYKAVIIDEFQDTDSIQWTIFKRLFVENPISAFYIVGDPKQSIYGFRSADLNTYFNAKKSMHHVAKLSTNYRSEPKLIQSLNAFFQKQKAFPYDPVYADPQKENTRFQDGKEPLHFFVAEVSKEREKNWPSPAIEQDYFFPFIAEEIIHLTQHEKQSFQDIAILVKDRYQATRLKTYLENLQIPALTKNTESLANSPLFSFFQALLHILETPHEVKYLLAHAIFGFSHEELKENSELLTEATAFTFRLKTLFENEGMHALIDALLHHKWKLSQTLLDLLVQNSKLEVYSDFIQFTELLLEESNNRAITLSHLNAFLNSIEMRSNENPKFCRKPLSELNAVTIMTIHMSKGLEFPIVFALGLINRYTARQDFVRHEKKWVSFNPEDPKCQSALQEEQSEKLRQLYVALTRAKKRLYVPVLLDAKQQTAAQEGLSPLELFLEGFPPLHELLSEIGASSTDLKPKKVQPLKTNSPELFPQKETILHFPCASIHSFSSLVTHTPPISPEDSPDTLPKGSQTGLLFHALFETIIKEKLSYPYNHEKIEELIVKRVAQTPFQPWQSQISALIEKAFHLPLSSFNLASILPHNLHTETEFLFSLNSQNSLKGFIDLIFFHQGAYYLLDWKTNLLPDYSPESLHQAMIQNEYILQAKIYAEALSRYLKSKQDCHPIAGAYYLFVRGLSEGQGVYFLSPLELKKANNKLNFSLNK